MWSHFEMILVENKNDKQQMLECRLLKQDNCGGTHRNAARQSRKVRKAFLLI